MKWSRGDQSGGDENKRKRRTTIYLSVVNILKTEFNRE